MQIENDTIEWLVNGKLQCTQNNIDKTIKCWYFGIAMLGKNDSVEIIKFATTNTKCNEIEQEQQDDIKDGK